MKVFFSVTISLFTPSLSHVLLFLYLAFCNHVSSHFSVAALQKRPRLDGQTNFPGLLHNLESSLSSFLHNLEFYKVSHLSRAITLYDLSGRTRLIRTLSVTTNGTFVVPKVGKAAVCVNPGPDYTIDLRHVRRPFSARFESILRRFESVRRS